MGVARHTIFIKVFLIFSILVSACGEIDYTPHVTPMILGTLETPSIFQTPESLATEIPPKLLDLLTSDEAIDLCEEREYHGDETMGSCLAPGGDSYYVWISPEEVMEVDRTNEFLQAFRFAALNRSDKIGDIQETTRG
jgi:hypothetical protein